MSDRCTVRTAEVDGRAACVLHDEAADLRGTWVPGAGMLGASLVHAGEELLWQGAGVGAYAREGKFMGIPFLYPWANRLAGFEYHSGGHDVVLQRSSPLLKLDDHGLPIHGLLNGDPNWTVQELTAQGGEARLIAALEFDRPELVSAFPFPHRVEIEVRLAGGEVTVTTTVIASGGAAVPVAFGFHPYLQLPGRPRAQWEISFPLRRHLLLDDRGIPTGEAEPVQGLDGRIADRTWDDAFDQLEPPARFDVTAGGRSISVHYDDGYPVAQVFAPPGQEYVCAEPMTAPTNSLAGPDGVHPWVTAGERWSATFRITCSAQ
jgi:aldose 1-epimerase